MSERKLASIQKIIKIQPIENADNIEKATVLAWDVVVKKGAFKEGDYCCYFEIDSIIPFKPWSYFLRDINKPEKPIRLRTKRLRKVLSQGLIIPLGEVFADIPIQDTGYINPEEDMDLTALLGITKWEPEIPAELKGLIKGNFPTYLVSKTDEERIQNKYNILDEFKKAGDVVVTLKLDGTSATYIFNKDSEGNREFHVCGRNMEFLECDNVYWQIARQFDLDKIYDLLEKDNPPGRIALQGEIVGPGIQKNRLGLKEIQFFIFNIYSINLRSWIPITTDNANHLDFMELKFKFVPILYQGPVPWNSVSEVLDYADTFKYDSGKQAEGIVIRPVVETYSPSLQGRLSIKAISNKFLLKEED